MDSQRRGPITIRPVERPDVPWTPTYTPPNGDQAGSARLGEIAGDGNPKYPPSPSVAMANGLNRQDPTRYTVPYKINSDYYKDPGLGGGFNGDGNGGNDSAVLRLQHTAVPVQISKNNEYVKTYNCRGHYFAGSKVSQETQNSKRYPGCNN
jgi:hypothetical protein